MIWGRLAGDTGLHYICVKLEGKQAPQRRGFVKGHSREIWLSVGEGEVWERLPQALKGEEVGEGIGSKKEHGWKFMWQKTRNFGSQMSDVQRFQFRSLGVHPRTNIVTSTSGISFLQQIFFEHRGLPGTLSGAGNTGINVQNFLPLESLFLVSLIREAHRSWAHLKKVWLKRCWPRTEPWRAPYVRAQ